MSPMSKPTAKKPTVTTISLGLYTHDVRYGNLLITVLTDVLGVSDGEASCRDYFSGDEVAAPPGYVEHAKKTVLSAVQRRRTMRGLVD